ncbi:hypothetical protein BDV59DRAFT_201453 [Aspergillus ambiguus]|uniref:uncharacterized protein n=1 Tax=Aspergillus ambiguus TaxID=176160 RepID=UPI003CCD79F6
MTSRFNRGNYSTLPREDVEEFSRKEDQDSSQSGFASMGRDKQPDPSSMSGQGSSGTFDTGDIRTSASDQKSGYSSKYHFTHDELSHPDE